MAGTVIGVLVDCSGSMEGSLARERGDGHGPEGTKFDSLRDAVDRLVHEIRPRLDRAEESDITKVFVLGFGLRVPGHAVCDLLTLRRVYREEAFRPAADSAESEEIFEGNGHREFRLFAESEGYERVLTVFVNRYLSSEEAHHLTRALQRSPRAVEEFKTLIPQTKVKAAGKWGLTRFTSMVGFEDPFQRAKDLALQLIAQERGESPEAIRQRIENRAIGSLKEQLDAEGPSMLTLREVIALWPGRESAGSGFGDARRILLGGTPMCAAMQAALVRFTNERLVGPDTEKVLLVLTDGQPTDGDPRPIAAELKDHGVSIYSCFVADADVAAAKRLFGVAQADWTAAATLMFDMASAVRAADQSVQVLREYGWRADDECRLFAQVNHSEVLSQFTRSVLRNVVDPEDFGITGLKP